MSLSCQCDVIMMSLYYVAVSYTFFIIYVNLYHYFVLTLLFSYCSFTNCGIETDTEISNCLVFI